MNSDLSKGSGILLQNLDSFQRKLEAQTAVREHILKESVESGAKLKNLETAIAAHEEALIVINAVTEAKRAELRAKVEDLTSFALSEIFETDYRFVLKMEQRGQQVELQFKVRDPYLGNHEVDLLEARGGGLVQVVAFIMKLLVVLSSRPPLRRILFMDEPLRMVSAAFTENLCNFIKQIAEKTGFQFVIITHDQGLATMGDKAYNFRLVQGETQVEPIQ